MAISFVGAGAISTGSNPSVAVPAGYAANDYLILTLTVASSTPTFPSGWTLLSNSTTLYVVGKFASASESAAAITVTDTSTKAVMVAYRGVSKFDTASAVATGTSTTSLTTNTLTTALPNEYIVDIFGVNSGSTATFTVPGSLTSRVNSSRTSGTRGLVVADELQAAAGTTTARTVTASAAVSYAAASIALRPATTFYWIGGSGTWNATSGTNWSLSSGGSTAGTAPAALDAAVIDTNSGTGTITCTSASAVCGDLTVTATQAIVLGASSSGLSLYGNLTLPSSGSFSASTNAWTLTVAGSTAQSISGTASLYSVTFGNTGTCTLNSALTAVGTIVISGGSLNTNNQTVTTGSNITYSNSGVAATLTLGTSTINVGGSWSFNTSSNLTFSGASSTINITKSSSPASVSFTGGGLTYGTVNISSSGSGSLTSVTIAQNNTFTNLAITNNNRLGTTLISLPQSGTQTVTGTLTITGTDYNQRFGVYSGSFGTATTLNAAAVSLSYVDFVDTVGAGAATWTGTSIGNAGGNTGITFTSPKTVYWNLAGTQTWAATGWATSSGGTPANANYPLPQDTAIIDNSSAGTSITFDSINVTGNIDGSTRTSAIVLNFGTSTSLYLNGSISLGSGVDCQSSGGGSYFIGRSSHTIDVYDNIASSVTINAFGGTYSLARDFSGTTLTLSRGTFDANNYNVTLTNSFSGAGTSTRALTMGSGTWTLSGITTVWDMSTTTNLTFSGASATINLSDTSTVSRTFITGGLAYGTLNIGGPTGSSTTTITSGASATFAAITSTKTVAHTITFSSSATVSVASWGVNGSAGNLVTINSSTSGTAASLSYTGTGVAKADYLSVQDITFLPAVSPTQQYAWYLGTNSTNVSNISNAAFVDGNTYRAYRLSTGTSWTVPTDWTNVNEIHMIGGGGGGSGAANSGASLRAGGGGGGGGGYTKITNFATTPGSSITYAIGAGGTGGSSGSISVTAGSGGSTTWNSNAYSAGGGGGGGANANTPISVSGSAGVGSTYNGGAGGLGSSASSSTTGHAGGGGGGAGGPNGNGGSGGNGFPGTSSGIIASGGGGGNGGGTAGANAASTVGGTGGNNFLNTGGGTGGTTGADGTKGGGGGGDTSTTGIGGSGGSGIDIYNTLGGGGGAAGSAAVGKPSNNGLYGGGGGGAGCNTSGTLYNGGTGSQGVIFVLYNITSATSTSNFFLLF